MLAVKASEIYLLHDGMHRVLRVVRQSRVTPWRRRKKLVCCHESHICRIAAPYCKISAPLSRVTSHADCRCHWQVNWQSTGSGTSDIHILTKILNGHRNISFMRIIQRLWLLKWRLIRRTASLKSFSVYSLYNWKCYTLEDSGNLLCNCR